MHKLDNITLTYYNNKSFYYGSELALYFAKVYDER